VAAPPNHESLDCKCNCPRRRANPIAPNLEIQGNLRNSMGTPAVTYRGKKLSTTIIRRVGINSEILVVGQGTHHGAGRTWKRSRYRVLLIASLTKPIGRRRRCGRLPRGSATSDQARRWGRRRSSPGRRPSRPRPTGSEGAPASRGSARK
jgi:hypothetical protein